MNREIKKYIRHVNILIPFSSKDKKEFMELFKKRIQEYEQENKNVQYGDLIDYFGTPQDVASSYVKEMDVYDLLEQLTIRRAIKVLIAFIIVCAAIISAIKIYRLQQLYDEACIQLGGYMTEIIEEDKVYEIQTATYDTESSNVKYKRGSKVIRYFDVNDNKVWDLKVVAGFVYDGESSSCISTAVFDESASTAWQIYDKKISKQDNTVTGSATVVYSYEGNQIGLQTVSAMISCSKDGVLK